MGPCGLLILNKPTEMSSRQAVDRVLRLARPAKVGHAGTLDPLATGVLVVCVGAATRLIEYVQRMPKRYVGTFLLGRSSPTEDIEGPVAELVDPPVPTPEQLAAALPALTGAIQQRPPAHSAVKVDGHRAYTLARKGQEVELKPRPVTIYRLAVQAYRYPELTLEIECSGGTYVRSLGRDLALSLGTAAVMSALVRTAIGDFRLEESIGPGELTPQDWTGHLLQPLRAVPSLPRIDLSDDEVRRVRQGLFVPRKAAPPDAAEVAAVDAAGRLVAILRPRGAGQLGPLRNLAEADAPS